jgi:UDP-N-acetyl-D-mannosaminuronic acid dehydrogenase
MKSISVIGTGYVGLPAALMLARAGHKVTGVDIDEEIVNALNRGEMHIDEPALKKILDEPEVRANLKASNTPDESDVFFIAVPTPVLSREKIADLSYVVDALESIIPHLRKGNLVVIESTIPPLTCKEVVKPLIEKTGLIVGDDILLAHCPERILPGDIFQEIVYNDRLIGGIDKQSGEAARDIYASFVKGKLIVTDVTSAEMAKLVENTFRDVNIALANEIADVCETIDADPLEVIAMANLHPRVNILQPGIGVGGHCIPIDPWFIKQVDPENAKLIFTAREINQARPAKIAANIRLAVAKLDAPEIALIGATYKANTNDLRESPALEIYESLHRDGYNVTVFDPIADDYPMTTLEDLASKFDCIAILIEHDVIIEELAEKEAAIRQAMRNPLIMRFYTR